MRVLNARNIAVMIGGGFFAAALIFIYDASKGLSDMRDASAYVDQGVHTFTPIDSEQLEHKTTFVVNYKSDGEPEYLWVRKIGPDQVKAESIVSEGLKVDRRVLAVPAEETYITIDPVFTTAESYNEDLRANYYKVLAFCLAYSFLFAAGGFYSFYQRRRLKKTGMMKL